MIYHSFWFRLFLLTFYSGCCNFLFTILFWFFHCVWFILVVFFSYLNTSFFLLRQVDNAVMTCDPSIQYNIIQYNTIQYNTVQYNKSLCNCKLPITRNIDKIVVLAAINKSVSPNSIKAQCYCAYVP